MAKRTERNQVKYIRRRKPRSTATSHLPRGNGLVILLAPINLLQHQAHHLYVFICNFIHFNLWAA
jgi:hypothetical protein